MIDKHAHVVFYSRFGEMRNILIGQSEPEIPSNHMLKGQARGTYRHYEI